MADWGGFSPRDGEAEIEREAAPFDRSSEAGINVQAAAAGKSSPQGHGDSTPSPSSVATTVRADPGPSTPAGSASTAAAEPAWPLEDGPGSCCGSPQPQHPHALLRHAKLPSPRTAGRRAAAREGIEALDYLPADSEAYRRWLRAQPRQRGFARWLAMFALGVVVGCLGFALHFCIQSLSKAKARASRLLLLFAHIVLICSLSPSSSSSSVARIVIAQSLFRCSLPRSFFQVETMRAILRHSAALAWLFDIVYSCFLVAAAAAVVLAVRPSAGGSGVPEVMAYLNGCELRSVFDFKTAAVKFLSCALAVSSGLPVGARRAVAAAAAAMMAAWGRAAVSKIFDFFLALNHFALLPRSFRFSDDELRMMHVFLFVPFPLGPEGPMIFLGASAGALLVELMGGATSATAATSSSAERSGKVGSSSSGRAAQSGRDAPHHQHHQHAGGSSGRGRSSGRRPPPRSLASRARRLFSFPSFLSPNQPRFHNNEDKRDLMAAGVAAGVAAAFGAPVGGLLFAFEDVASFWRVQLGWQTFFACTVAVLTRSVADSLRSGTYAGLFEDSVLFEARGVVLSLLTRCCAACFPVHRCLRLKAPSPHSCGLCARMSATVRVSAGQPHCPHAPLRHGGRPPRRRRVRRRRGRLHRRHPRLGPPQGALPARLRGRRRRKQRRRRWR